MSSARLRLTSVQGKGGQGAGRAGGTTRPTEAGVRIPGVWCLLRERRSGFRLGVLSVLGG